MGSTGVSVDISDFLAAKTALQSPDAKLVALKLCEFIGALDNKLMVIFTYNVSQGKFTYF